MIMSKRVPLSDDIQFRVDPICMSCYGTFILLPVENLIREGGFCLIDFSESRSARRARYDIQYDYFTFRRLFTS